MLGSVIRPSFQPGWKILVIVNVAIVEASVQQIHRIRGYTSSHKQICMLRNQEIENGTCRRWLMFIFRSLERIRTKLKYLGTATPQSFLDGSIQFLQIMDRHPVRRIGVDNIDFASGFRISPIDGHEYTGRRWIWKGFFQKSKNVRQIFNFRISTYRVLHHIWLDPSVQAHVGNCSIAS